MIKNKKDFLQGSAMSYAYEIRPRCKMTGMNVTNIETVLGHFSVANSEENLPKMCDALEFA